MKNVSLPTAPTVAHKDDNVAEITIGSLYPGYGITLGNALRRVMLSSLPGAAITSVKIEGADHEFTTFPNVKEDAIHVLLNLKQVRFRLHGDEAATISLSASGKGEVTAEAFEASSEVDIANPEAVIATLTDKKATFKLEAEISPGLGYEPVERRKKEKLPVGSIALDAIYTPVRRANFRVENMRVGDRTDFNRLIFDVETDGTITPEEAFKKATEILEEHIDILKDIAVPEEKENS